MQFRKKDDQVTLKVNEHHEEISKAFASFNEFFTVLLTDNPDVNRLASIKVNIDSCEASADRKVRETILLLKKSFLPSTRKNIISILQLTDEIANRCQSVTRQIMLEKIRLPKDVHSDVLEIIKITAGQLKLIYTATEQLFNDYKTIYKDRTILHDISVEETHIDNIENLLHERIFNLDLSLCEKIYYTDVIKNICQISDILEDIADQIQIMLIEREA